MLTSSFLFASSAYALLSLSLNRKHLLVSLLILEIFTLSMSLAIPVILISFNSLNMMYTITLLTMGACEASLGLSLLVSMTQSTGNDLLKSINTNLC